MKKLSLCRSLLSSPTAYTDTIYLQPCRFFLLLFFNLALDIRQVHFNSGKETNSPHMHMATRNQLDLDINTTEASEEEAPTEHLKKKNLNFMNVHQVGGPCLSVRVLSVRSFFYDGFYSGLKRITSWLSAYGAANCFVVRFFVCVWVWVWTVSCWQ